MNRSNFILASVVLCIWMQRMVLLPVHAQSNGPAGEVERSNTVPSLPPAMVVSNLPPASNTPPGLVVTNRNLTVSNSLPALTNFTFVQQTNYGPPIYTPPKKPWWRRFWDWLF